MRLRTVHRDIPLLTSNPEILESLESVGIKTTNDLLFTPLPDLLLRLTTAEGILTTDIITLQEQIATATAAECTRGDELYTKEVGVLGSMQTPNEHLGIQALDDLFGPTLSGPYVIELSGTTGCGKSTLAMQLVTRCLVHNLDASALWVDTSGEFSSERIHRMCAALGLEGQDDATLGVLERLQVVLSLELEEFQGTLDSVEASLDVTQ
ncbi:hypothetical protein FRC10_003889 [Ceratobasidium sp. 414]|nr:hypothetical protein FRC10_003889 [Ceratobasidium sp. 414]